MMAMATLRNDEDQLTAIAQRMTPHRSAFEAMGFRFRMIGVRWSHDHDGMMLRADFECVCGKVEVFHQILPPFELMAAGESMMGRYLDPARILIEDIGSTSPKHLRADGYSEEDIAEIQRKGRQALEEMGHAARKGFQQSSDQPQHQDRDGPRQAAEAGYRDSYAVGWKAKAPDDEEGWARSVMQR